jgi:hypothetical protein
MQQRFQQPEEQTITISTASIRENDLTMEAQLAEEQAQQRREVDAWLEEIRQESAKRKCRQRRITIGVVSIYGISLLGAAVAMITTHHFDFGALGSLGSVGGLAGWAMMGTKRHKEAAKHLAELGDARSVGPLAETLSIPDPQLRSIVEGALIRLLPQMRADQADLLNAEQRACLYRVMNGKNPELTIAILKGLEQIGDEKALPIVQKLAEREVKPEDNLTHTTDSVSGTVQPSLLRKIELELFGDKIRSGSRIREAARECLPYLQERIAQERARETLLRASDTMQSTPDTLLRAAEGVPAVDPRQLLRAGIPNETAAPNG